MVVHEEYQAQQTKCKCSLCHAVAASIADQMPTQKARCSIKDSRTDTKGLQIEENGASMLSEDVMGWCLETKSK